MGLKKAQNKLLKILSLVALFSVLHCNVALADQFGFTVDNSGSTPNCELLNTPTKIDNIVTIIEEPFTNTTSRGYATCIRRTCCESAEGNCKSSFGETMAPPPKTSTKQTTSTDTQEYASFKKCYYDYTGPGNCTPNTSDAITVSCKRIGIFFANSGSELLYAYIGAIYRFTATTMGIVCVFIIVWNGFNIATAGDQTAKLDEGKKKIMQSLYGLVILFLSAVILYSINPNFFVI